MCVDRLLRFLETLKEQDFVESFTEICKWGVLHVVSAGHAFDLDLDR